MKHLTPWDPFRNLLSLQDRMNRLFDETITRGDTETMKYGAWSPAVDIYETDTDIVLSAEIPGMDASDVDVEVNDNTLTLKGERKMEKDVKEESYHRVERAYGSFVRSFTLPSTVDQEKISANYSKGVLEIKIPKTQARKTKISIESGD